MGIVAPPAKCPACAADVPWGSDVGGGVHRYGCIKCGHAFDVRAVDAPVPFAPVNPYAPSAPAPAPPPIAAAPQAAKICAACRKENPPQYRFCLGCGGDLSHPAPPRVASPAGFAPPARTTARKPIRAIVLGVVGFNGIFWALFALFFTSPKACAMFSPGNEGLAIETLKKCPRARALLGDDLGPAWFGCTTGSSQGDCNSENARWSTAVSGSKARGDFGWAAQEKNGTWTIRGAWLHVGAEEIDIVKCNTHGDGKSEDVEIDDSD